MAHPPKDNHPAAAERRVEILDALLGEIRYSSPVTMACERWDRKLGLKDAETIFLNLKRLADKFAAPDYAERLRRAAVVWKSPAFQRGVVRLLTRIGFPEMVATALAPRMLYVCLDWAGCHVPPERPWPEESEGPPAPPFSVPPRAVRGGRRGPRREHEWLSPSRRLNRKAFPPYVLWAHWYFRVDICGEPQTAVATYFGPRARHEFLLQNQSLNAQIAALRKALTAELLDPTKSEEVKTQIADLESQKRINKDCDKRAVRRGLKQTRDLLGMAGVGRRGPAREPLHPLVGVPILVTY